ncbi:MAG: transcription antitermination factor NusB [Clostridia bacterium]
MGRKKARDNAFKCIYQLAFYGNNNAQDILKFCYEENENEEEEKEYIQQVLGGVMENLGKIDEIILSKLKKWSMDRIAKVDIAILRLAVYEIMFMKNIPPKVTANEAVELAKTYGDSDSKAFVNGVIAKIIEDKEDASNGKNI